MRPLLPTLIATLLFAAVVRADDQCEPIDVACALDLIVREAKASWEAGGQWPRSVSDFAEDSRYTIDPVELHAALGRRLYRNPALDAYAKWQLMSFGAEVSEMDAERRRAVFQNLPQVVGQPQPRVRDRSRRGGGDGRAFIFIGRQRAFVADLRPVVVNGVVAFDPEIAVISEGTLLDVEGVVTANRSVMLTVRAASSQLTNLRNFATQLNQPIFRFRAAIADQLPPGAERLAFYFQDAADRAQAGNPSFKPALSRFVDETRRLRTSRDLSPRVRRRMIEQVKQLARHRQELIREIEIVGEDQYQVHKTTIAVPEDVVHRAVANLEGRAPEVKR